MTKKPKLVYSIKGKLVSAVCMLLVAMIMVVSSTYAWFTLSTAPEVTGITTAVGSNGALEMGLLSLNGTVPGPTTTEDGVGDNWKEKNLTWGNLVDLSDGYGLDQIKLYPSVLNLSGTGTIDQTASILSIPGYDYTGRPGALENTTSTGTYSALTGGGNGFVVDSNYGVRAIGASSSMTPRQLEYRNTLAAGKSDMGLATNRVSSLLNANGNALATIALKIAMSDAPTFDSADLTAIGTILNGLDGANSPLAAIESSLKNYILAYAASKTVQTAEGTYVNLYWTAVKTKVEAATALSDVLDVSGDTVSISFNDATAGDVSVPLPTSFATAYTKYTALAGAVDTAQSQYATLAGTSQTSYTLDEFSPIFNTLVNPSDIMINGMSISEAKQNIFNLVSGGVNVQMPSGSGLFADIADLCGDYSTPVSVDGEDLTIGGTEMTGTLSATMITASEVNPSYLMAAYNATKTAGAPDAIRGENEATTLDEFYGYIIDLAFRTNAQGSFLRLQTKGVDRIYEGNANEATMGHGSSMTFETSDASFTPDMIAKLMSALRIVFFNTENGEIYAEARLDMACTEDENGTITDRHYAIDGKKVTGYMYILIPKTEYYIAGTDGAPDTILTKVGDKYYTKYVAEGSAENVEYTVTDGVTVSDREIMVYATQEEAKIVDLQQGQAHKVSTLVYLDGNIVDNSMVPAEGNLTGTMNLQFSSSADLVPMENGTLHTPE